MKAAVVHGPGKVTCDTVDDPVLKDERDVILQNMCNGNVRHLCVLIFAFIPEVFHNPDR